MKKCPYCAEEIKPEAVKCKHCQSELIINNKKRINENTDSVVSRILVTGSLMFIAYLVFQNLVSLSQPSFPEMEQEVRESEARLEKLRQAFDE